MANLQSQSDKVWPYIYLKNKLRSVNFAPMANSWFQFKQFTIHQQKAAMKVTTDACLFGALQPAFPDKGANLNLLDIGAGTGLLSLMVAQLNPEANISAIEIDAETAREAAENIANSPFSGQLRVVQADILDFYPEKGFHHIFCNPPFYQSQLQSPDTLKNTAHHASNLSLESLFACFNRLLLPGGTVSLLLPFYRESEALVLSGLQNLNPTVITRVKQSSKHGFFRTILFLGGEKHPPETSEITIRDAENRYTPEFERLLKPFYLKL